MDRPEIQLEIHIAEIGQVISEIYEVTNVRIDEATGKHIVEAINLTPGDDDSIVITLPEGLGLT